MASKGQEGIGGWPRRPGCSGSASNGTRRPVRTFGIGCADDRTYDETAYARLVARDFGTDLTELVLEPVAIALTGDGGDDLFAGHLRFYGAVVAERLPVRRLVDAHLAGQADHGHQLWALLTLETFLQQEGRA